jgi:hypothetical protein
MPLENDFLPFATGSGANVESQSAWTSDSVVGTGFQNGIANPQQVNKALRQATTIAAMIAQFICDYAAQPALDNGSISTLEANLNVAIQAVIAAYAASHNLASTPWVTGNFEPLLGFTPVQQGGGASQGLNKIYLGWDGLELRLQVDATDMGGLASTSWTTANFEPLLNFTPVQQGGGHGQGTNKIYLGWDSVNGNLRLQVDATDMGGLVRLNQINSSLYPHGYQLFPPVFPGPGGGPAVGLILQWGSQGSITGNGDTITLPTTFPNQCFVIVPSDIGGTNHVCSATYSLTGSVSQFQAWCHDPGSTGYPTATTTIGWMAVGY